MNRTSLTRFWAALRHRETAPQPDPPTVERASPEWSPTINSPGAVFLMEPDEDAHHIAVQKAIGAHNFIGMTAEPIPAPVAEPAPQEITMSFLSKFKVEFEKLFHVLPNWIHTGEAVISFAAPVVVAIVAQFDPAVAVVAAPIVAEIQADLTTASVLVGDGTASPSLTQALNSLQANLKSLLAAGHIKDAKIQADVTLVVNEVAALVSELPSATPAAPAAPAKA